MTQAIKSPAEAGPVCQASDRVRFRSHSISLSIGYNTRPPTLTYGGEFFELRQFAKVRTLIVPL